MENPLREHFVIEAQRRRRLIEFQTGGKSADVIDYFSTRNLCNVSPQSRLAFEPQPIVEGKSGLDTHMYHLLE